MKEAGSTDIRTQMQGELGATIDRAVASTIRTMVPVTLALAFAAGVFA